MLLFMAGDRASRLIQTALRAFATANGIPVDDPAFQESVCLQAGTMIAKTKRSPSATEVMQSLGKSAMLKKLISSIENGAHPSAHTLHQSAPKAPAPPPLSAPIRAPSPSPFATPGPVAAIEPKPAATVAQAIHTAHQEPHLAAPGVDVARPKKMPVNIDMGPEIDIDINIEDGEPINPVQTLKNRWLTGHDY